MQSKMELELEFSIIKRSLNLSSRLLPCTQEASKSATLNLKSVCASSNKVLSNLPSAWELHGHSKKKDYTIII